MKELRRARPPFLILTRATTSSLSTDVVFRQEAECHGHFRQERAFVFLSQEPPGAGLSEVHLQVGVSYGFFFFDQP